MTGMADRIEAMELPAEKNTLKVSNTPVVSIIVPTFNRGRFLERCLRSILEQTYPNIECLVMDGGSKDESVAILKRLAESDPRLKYISEPDNGEVYATNKGFDLATGEIIGLQASDDFYVPDALQKAGEFLLARPKYVGAAGEPSKFYVQGRSVDTGRCPVLRVRSK